MSFPVAPEYIAHAEEELKRTLPEPLTTRLMRENGGSVRAEGEIWWLHPVFDRTDRKRIARSANHIIRETEARRQWSGFPDGAVAIADKGSGDALILMPGSDRIERWDHETGAHRTVTVRW